MKTQKDILKELLKELTEYLEKWLSGAKDIQKAAPKVQEIIDLIKWVDAALSDGPDQVIRNLPPNVKLFLQDDLDMTRKALPIPKIDPTFLNISKTITSDISSTFYRETRKARHSDDPQTNIWGVQYSEKYEELQDQHEKVQQVRNLLFKLKNLESTLPAEFDDAVSAYGEALAGTVPQFNAGIAMRNVLERYKGAIMNLARQYTNVQKPNWKLMSKLIVYDIPLAREVFTKEESKWSELHTRLSELAKEKIEIDKAELRSIFTEFIDHLHIVLLLINKGG